MSSKSKRYLFNTKKLKKEYNRLNELLKGLTYLPIGEEFWGRLSEFSFDLFRNGVVVRLTDTYIALLCIENNVSLLHRDKRFDLTAQKSSLKVL